MKTLILTTIALHSIIAHAGSTDPLYAKQWALENNGQVILKSISDLERVQVKGIPGVDIHYVETKDIATTKNELIVAVLDSGVDITHPDLQGRIWYNEARCKGATNAAILPCNGFNFLDNNNSVIDDIGHGTHVAGVIAANRNNIGVAGAADPRVKIMPLKVLNSQVNGFVYNGKVITDIIADALTFAVQNGAEVVNLSLGWPKLVDLAKVKAAFDLAEKNNVTIIAAAGNNDKDLPTFPCAYENVICVGAIDNRGDLTDFTNYGSKVDVVAPGESIVSTFPSALESRVLRIKNYESKRGSSQAAPFVTAAIATLKLLHPGLSNDQVRDLLFRSSKKLTGKVADNHFVKFGMLDEKALLDLANTKEINAFVNPQIKSLTEVKFSANDRKFSFNLNLKNLSGVNYKGLVCLRAKSNAIQIDQNCISVDLIEARKNLVIPVTGLINNLSNDSHILIEIQIDEKIYQTSLVFSRDLNNDSEVISHSLGQASFDDMAVISGDRRLSRMSRVFDKYKYMDFPEYFYSEKLKQTETQTNISLLTNENGKFVVKNILIPKVNKVLSIHRQDINMDGKLDYFIYSLSSTKDQLVFTVLDDKLNPLFKDLSTWTMALSTFEGLPIDGGVEKFEWIKTTNDKLGTILVPSIYRSYTMPEADNSKVISDRILSSMSHQYYLNPIVKNNKVTIELRVVDSVKMMLALEKELGIKGSYDTKTAYLLKPFPQTEAQSRAGVINSLIGVVEDGAAKLSQVTLSLSGKNYSDLKALSAEKSVDQSLIYPIFDSKTGAVTNEAVFTTLLNRSSAEFLVKNDSEIGSILRLNENWENPIIGLIATYSEGVQKSYLIENRSSLTLLRDNEEKSSLPIYRDSSFPGQSFSETLTPILSQGRPGVYINSTLIYGERLYSMIDTQNNGFIRPLRLSIGIPTGCVPLLPEPLADKSQYNYVFLCTEPSRDVSLKFLPMSHQ
jgi:cell wall-associated protease